MDTALHGQRSGPQLSTGLLRPFVSYSPERSKSILSVPISGSLVRGILLDIEGTTTPLDFVYQVLFPYARAHVKDFLGRHIMSQDVLADAASLLVGSVEDRRQGLSPPTLEYTSHEARLNSLVAYVHWLMDQDRKSTPLKSLQGKIWEEGYRTGELRGQVFPDVRPAMERWRKQKRNIAIFSSGSVLAQKLLFANTTAGDLTKFIQAYFDTTTGPKTEPESYRLIAEVLDRSPSEILFVSDVTAELDAARLAGAQTALCIRPGNLPQTAPHTHAVIGTFDEISSGNAT